MTDSPPPDWRAILGSATPRVSFGNPGVRPMRKISDTQEWWDQTIMVRGPFRPSKAAAASPFVVEQDAAAKARTYHDAARKVFPFEARRRDLARFAADFYKNRLRIRGTAGTRAAIEALANPDTLLIEMAHDGQLPHLGIVRLVLKADAIARMDRKALTLYLIGNHYTAEMRPENLRFGAPLKGGSPDEVKHPPKVRVGKARSHTPFRWLRPPTSHGLHALRKQIDDFVENNVAHEMKAGGRLRTNAKRRIAVRLDQLFGMMHLAAEEVENLGDWLIRIQHDLFHLMLGHEADRILFLPMADLTDLVRPELTLIADRSKEVDAIKAAVAGSQIAQHGEPYQRGPQSSTFWVHCPSCFRRTRQPWRPGTPVEFVCPTCANRAILAGEGAWDWVMPDIVGYEVALFRLGLGGWVVGSHAPYHPVIEQAYSRLFRCEMPPKFFLTSVPMFRGIGDPADGYGRTRLLRAFLEMEPSALAAALSSPWSDDPKIHSDLLRFPDVPSIGRQESIYQKT